MQGQNCSFDIFVLQQSPRLRFNRGALLNAGVLLLAGGQYSHFVFHDVVSTSCRVLLGPAHAQMVCHASGWSCQAQTAFAYADKSTYTAFVQDTLPVPRGNLPYAHPAGDRPLHLTGPGLHPRVNYEVLHTLPLCFCTWG